MLLAFLLPVLAIVLIPGFTLAARFNAMEIYSHSSDCTGPSQVVAGTLTGACEQIGGTNTSMSYTCGVTITWSDSPKCVGSSQVIKDETSCFQGIGLVSSRKMCKDFGNEYVRVTVYNSAEGNCGGLGLYVFAKEKECATSWFLPNMGIVVSKTENGFYQVSRFANEECRGLPTRFQRNVTTGSCHGSTDAGFDVQIETVEQLSGSSSARNSNDAQALGRGIGITLFAAALLLLQERFFF